MNTSSDSASAFTEYMAKSHEEKLKALKDLETKKNAEIEALKKDMEQMKSSSNSSSNSSSTSMVVQTSAAPNVQGSDEDLSEKLFAYQKFMSDYIVKAQLEKYNAVKAAEAAIAKKYEEKLNAFMLPGDSSSSSGAGIATTTTTTTTSGNEQSKLFQERNANVAAAAKAGKSRWGGKEIEKVSGLIVPKSVSSSQATHNELSSSSVSLDTIAAADHGLRADGGVGGLTLAERVTRGAGTADTSIHTLYQIRNENIANAAKAGKSRWGGKEIEKVSGLVVTRSISSSQATHQIPPAPASLDTIAAADHGLRADGGVGGLTLAERVTGGAGTDGVTVPASQSLFALRNVHIANAAKAGKQSRWGGKEESKAVEVSASLPPGFAVVETVEVVAANHGLRADGGVSGPSLAERVNLGAMLVN